MKTILTALALFLLLALPAQAFDAGRFQQLHVKIPAIMQGVNPTPPLGLAYVISDAAGWGGTEEAAALDLQSAGWLAVGLNLAKYRDSLIKGDDECHDVGDELIDLSQALQRELNITTYQTPVLIGFGQGGVLAYGAAKQALPASFVAGVAIVPPGAAGRLLNVPKMLCDGPPAKKTAQGWLYDLSAPIKVPFKVYTTREPDVSALIKSYEHAAPAPNSIADLPLVPLPAAAGVTGGPRNSFVIFISGDGGWRDLDKTIAEALQKQGVSVVGWDSLRYFWSAKTSEQLAGDLGRVITHYGALWHSSHVALVGYSFGADAIPFAYNRLPAELQSHVSLLGLLALSKSAAFEIEVEGYIGMEGDSDKPLAPELPRLPAGKVLCFYGEDDADDSACPDFAGRVGAQVVKTEGGHHFDEAYEPLAAQLKAAIKTHERADLD